MRLAGDIALVTGSARGLGAATARALVREGCAVAVTDIDTAAARELAHELGGASIGLHLDVRDRTTIEMAANEVTAQLGIISILVNNAGINRIGPSETYDEATWEEVVDINLTGVFRCCQVVGRSMLEARRGSIINLASIHSKVASPGRAAYCATKTGVVGLTRALAVEWAGRGVRVNAVAPGYMATDLTMQAIASGAIVEEELIERIPMGRLGTAEHVANSIVFLASAESEYMTGTTIETDGGYIAFGAPGPASRGPVDRGAP